MSQIHPDDLDSRWYSLANQGKELVQANKGLQGLVDYLWAYDVQPERHDLFQKFRLAARNELWRNASALNAIEKHRKKYGNAIIRKEEKDLESHAFELLGRDTQEYRRVSGLLSHKYRVNPSGVVMLSWIGHVEAGYNAFCSAYEGFRLALEDFNSYYKMDHFHISKSEWRKGYVDLVYGNIRGNTEYSAQIRAAFQVFAFGAFQNYSLTGDLGNTSLRQYFQESELVECFGLLNEYPFPEFGSLLADAVRDASTSKTIIMPPLLTKILSDIQRFRPLEIIPAPMTSFNSIFQVMDQRYWQSGSLSGTIKLTPVRDFVLEADETTNAVHILLGSQGQGKTTIETAGLYLGVQEGRTFIIPLSDSLNWPELAFIPVMGPPDVQKNAAYEYLTEKIKVKPKGIPVLMLNIVTNLKDLDRVELTKYDRVLLVKSHTDFKVDFDLLFKELGEIARSMGYSKSCGIIAVRNLGRYSADKRRKLEESDIDDAYNLLFSLFNWYPLHLDRKIGIVWDETGRSGMNEPGSSGESVLGRANRLFIREARRWAVPMFYAADSFGDIPLPVKQRAQNIIFGELPKALSDVKSPLENLLGSLSIDEGTAETVRRLTDNGFMQSKNHLLFWWDKRLPKNLELVSTNVAPFQVALRSMNNVDIKKAYAKQFEISDLFVELKDFESKGWLWKAEGAEEEPVKEERKVYA